MANPEHLAILKQGVEVWNNWREKDINLLINKKRVDLSDADLSDTDLSYADLRGANLRRADLNGADLSFANLNDSRLNNALVGNANLKEAQLQAAHLMDAFLSCTNLDRADLSGADLSRAHLRDAHLRDAILIYTQLNHADLEDADLRGADLDCADLRGANLIGSNFQAANLSNSDLRNANLHVAQLIGANLKDSNLSGSKLVCANFDKANLADADLSEANMSLTNLSNADLKGANLICSILVETDLTNANIQGAKVYGISAWNIEKKGLIQKDLVITRDDEPIITVDDLEMAQFIYLMLNNQKIRDVIDTLTSKAVLILGRFSEERKPLLNAIKEELRLRNYLPILFDFEKPAGRNLTETISILAKMSRFVIADLTDAKSIPQELSHIVPFTPSLPVLPIILEGQREYAMFEHFKAYPWVMPLHAYASQEAMLAEITEKIIEPAEEMVIKSRNQKG